MADDGIHGGDPIIKEARIGRGRSYDHSDDSDGADETPEQKVHVPQEAPHISAAAAPGAEHSSSNSDVRFPPAPMTPDGLPQEIHQNRKPDDGSPNQGTAVPETEHGGADSDPAAPEKGADGTTPDGEPLDPDSEKDPLSRQHYIDPIHGALLALLCTPRNAMRSELTAKIAQLSVERDKTVESITQLKAAAVAPPSGGGGKVGFMGALGARLGGNQDKLRNEAIQASIKEHEASLERINADDRATTNQRRLVCDLLFTRTIKAATAVYTTQQALSSAIEDFNAKFAASQAGSQLLKAYDELAANLGCTVEDLRRDIHNPNNHHADLEDIRTLTRAVCAEKEFAKDLANIEENAKILSREMDKVRSGLQVAAANGMDMAALDGEIGPALGHMNVPNCLLSRPEGAPVDGMSEHMAEHAKGIAEMVRSLVDSLMSKLGGSRGP